MRAHLVIAAVVLAALTAEAAAQCTCGMPTVMVPVDTPDGYLIAIVPLLGTPRLEISPYTDQPITVAYNDPARVPGAIDPSVSLLPVIPARRFKTQGVYPRGY